MSIWCSGPSIGFDAYDDEPQPNGGQVRSYATGWSNHYPTIDGDVEREASIELATIPAWCAGGEACDSASVGRWLRLSVDTSEHNFNKPTEVVGCVHASVVMDEAAVRHLAQELTEWLAIPKVSPT